MPDRDAGRLNIGLINSLATFSMVNKYGFIRAPQVRDGRVTDEVLYLSATEEQALEIAVPNAKLSAFDNRLTG